MLLTFLVLTAALGPRFNEPLTEMSTRDRYNKYSWGVENGWCMRLDNLTNILSELSRQCGNLNISQPYRPPLPVTGIALLFYL
jgi:hypothetical protein